MMASATEKTVSTEKRIVNVSSIYGELQCLHNEKLKKELQDIEHLTEERINEIIQWFLRDLKANKLLENGWPLTVNNAGISSTIVDEESFWSLDLSFPSEAIDEKAKRSKKVVTQTYEGAQKCLETNYYGAKHVTQALLPLVLKSSSPRILNVSSKLGQLKVRTLDNHDHKDMTFFKGPLTAEEGAKEAVRLALIPDGGPSGRLYPMKSYKMSSKILNTLSKRESMRLSNGFLRDLKANKFLENGRPLIVGFVITDFTSNTGELTSEEGAKSPVMVALLPDDGPSGVYFKQMQISSF
nr:hypothetical protein [Tanacetum cinerariifolium]